MGAESRYRVEGETREETRERVRSFVDGLKKRPRLPTSRFARDRILDRPPEPLAVQSHTPRRGGVRDWWEPQEGGKCLRHALNACAHALSADAFDDDELCEISASLPGGVRTHGDQHGFWSDDVLLEACTRRGWSPSVHVLIRTFGPSERDEWLRELRSELSRRTALICGDERHYKAVVHLPDESGVKLWYDADSLNSRDRPLRFVGQTADLVGLLAYDAESVRPAGCFSCLGQSTWRIYAL